MLLDNPWVNVYRPRPHAEVTLVCLPLAGSAASAFGNWAERMPEHIEVAAMEYPGRGSRRAETRFVRLHALVAAAFAGLRGDLERPFVFLGHCMGGLIGFELSRQLARHGGPAPIGLFVAGCRAPRLPPKKDPIFALPEAQLVEELRALNGSDDAILSNPTALALFLPLLRADLEMADTYAYRPRRACEFPIVALGGRDDRDTPPEDLNDWQSESTEPLRTRVYSGDHFFIRAHEAQVIDDVASDIDALVRQST
jgi:medium-chain acyl-[acyl-carrier-protein] hydrolase